MKTYFISDLHLNHRNIIKYCSRPFFTVDDMNKSLINKWNSIINKDDVVYYLGDLTYNKTSYWLSKLNGRIIFIKGNHDKNIDVEYFDNLILEYNNQKFLLIHNPYFKPEDWDGWMIHGHKHNNNLKEYPLINKENKTINVSCELLDYKPIEINELMSKI